MKPPRFSTATTFLVAIVLAWLEIAPAQAQEWAKARLNNSPRHAEWVEMKSGDRTIKAFVVYPERKDKGPVVLVIHEIFGLTDWVRGLCDQLAENGVIAIAPDLLSGQTLPTPMAPGKRSRLYRNRRLKRTSMLRQITR